MTLPNPLDEEDRAAFEAWTEKFWMFIEDKGDALHIWQAATAHTAGRCASIAEQSELEGGSTVEAIRASYRLE